MPSDEESEDSVSVTSSNNERSCKPPVEPVLFVIFFSIAVTESYSTSILLTRACTTVLGLNETNCTGVLAPQIEKEAQRYVSNIVLVKSLIEGIIPGIWSLFLGPWSDLNGRKPVMLFAIMGFLFSQASWIVLISTKSASVYYFITPSLNIALGGGVISIFTCVFSYLSDYCDERNRAFRMTMAQCSLLIGVVCGYFVSTEIFLRFSDGGQIYIFIISCISLILTLFYVSIFLEETVVPAERRKSVFKIKRVKEMFRTVFVERPNKTRPVIFLLMSMSAVSIMVFQGEASFRFLALRNMFAWTLSKYNLFFMVSCILGSFATFVTIYILKTLLHVGEVSICTIVALLTSLSGLLTGFSTTNLAFMISINIGGLSVLLNSMIKSELAKIIPKSDMGKAYALLSTLESLSPLVAAPAYKYLYSNVLSVMPLAIFFLSSALWGVIALMSIAVLIIRKLNGVYYTILHEEPPEDQSDSTVSA